MGRNIIESILRDFHDDCLGLHSVHTDVWLWFMFLKDTVGSMNQLASGGTENGLLPPPHIAYTHQGERARAMSASGKVTLSIHTCKT